MRPTFQRKKLRQYEFVLTNVLETVDTSAEDHRKLLADQEDAAKHKKLNAPMRARRAGEAGVRSTSESRHLAQTIVRRSQDGSAPEARASEIWSDARHPALVLI